VGEGSAEARLEALLLWDVCAAYVSFDWVQQTQPANLLLASYGLLCDGFEALSAILNKRVLSVTALVLSDLPPAQAREAISLFRLLRTGFARS
jgi:hypothetical protein